MMLFSGRQVWSSVRTVILASLALGVAVTQADAASIPLFNTGIADNGTLLPLGSVDPHYSLVASADPANPGPSAIVPTTIPVGFWFPNGPNSQWISPSADQSYPDGPGGNPPFNAQQGGTYSYQTTFDLTGFNLLTATITGGWATDNSGVDILINGVSTGQTSGSYTFLTAFSITSGFVSGINTLTFVTNNLCCADPNPTGLRVELRGSAELATAVPEPASLVLLATGLAVVVARRRLTRRP